MALALALPPLGELQLSMRKGGRREAQITGGGGGGGGCYMWLTEKAHDWDSGTQACSQIRGECETVMAS